MTDLPASIEAALLDAEFSGTEIIVLKKLLQEDALTLRELAGKTGKSTGVLDQAVKKLLKKGILAKEMINDAPKYTLRSLEVVLKWMEDDTKSKQEMMVRRHQNFETFIRSITIEQNGNRRPEMEYFEGREGMKKAYLELLNRGNDIVQYGPTLMLTEDDPLRDFKVQWFRERQRRGIFTRVITNDTVLGRRFQSRDPFEYRKTILVGPEAYPFMFEKMIVGETVACFQPELDRAVFVRYPEMAESERVFFERLWNKKVQKAPEAASGYDESTPSKPPLDVITIPFKTKTLSSLREFFLSKKSIAVLVGFGILSAALTYGLYLRDVSFNTKRVQERALSIAATGALQFDAEDIDQLHTADDISKPVYAKLIYQLNLIRSQNPGMKYAYIMRPTEDPVTLEFVADADGLNPYAVEDTDMDGEIDPSDDIQEPGEKYDIRNYIHMKELFVQGQPSVDLHAETDKWGTFLSGYGPIKDINGKVVALFGVDIEASTVQSLSKNVMVLALVYIGLFLLFILMRLMAFNRSLLGEIIDVMKPRRNVVFLCCGAVVAFFLSGIIYHQGVQHSIEELRQRVTTIATTGSLQFTASELDQLRTLQDTKKPIYKQVVEVLHNIRQSNADIKYVYLLRPTVYTTTFEFIAEADAYKRDLDALNDINNDGVSDTSDEIGYPGLSYDISHIDFLVRGAYFAPTATEEPYTDKWGTVFTGYAPIITNSGTIAALLAVDVDAGSVYKVQLLALFPLIVYIVTVSLYLLFWTPKFRSSLFSELIQHVVKRSILTRVGLGLVMVYWVIFGLYWYKEHLLVQEKGKRLVAIAATAASQINPDDLENLRFAKDMKSPEYQRVFKLLNDIRNSNPRIVYTYILRPTHVDGIWEFVVDADANYYVPSAQLDYTGDGIIDESDENVAPGVAFDIKYSAPKMYQRGLYEPVFEDSLILNQWGAGYSASAPIFKDGKPIAILAIDDAEQIHTGAELYE